jgi:hypothetical protein
VTRVRSLRTACALFVIVWSGALLFLFGPMFLRERDATAEPLPYDVIDGRPFDRLYARLRPGLGTALEDRVIFWIDR